MRQYLQGLGCILAVVAFVLIAALINRLTGLHMPEAALTLIILGLLIAIGYVYKRWNGPLFFAKDGKAMSRLWPFLLGVGTVLGPAKLFLSGTFPIPGVIPLVNAALLALSPVLAGMSMIGPMIVGSVFWKREPTWL
jgi:hypothetical protein